MKEKGGYLENLEMLKFVTEADSVEAYPELSVAEYANFREVKTTGMGDDVLFRSSSPVNPMKARNRYADSLAGVASAAEIKDDYANTYSNYFSVVDGR